MYETKQCEILDQANKAVEILHRNFASTTLKFDKREINLIKAEH